MYYMGQYSYYQLNIDYIIETYCVNKDKPVLQCNGKCHLSKQLDLASTTDSESNEGAINLLSESFFPVYFQSNDNVTFNDSNFSFKSTFNHYYLNRYIFENKKRLFRPPIS